MPKRNNVEVSEDFIGEPVRVGDYVAYSAYGNIEIHVIKRLRLRFSKYAEPCVVGELCEVSTNYKRVIPISRVIKINTDRAMIYKLSIK